MPIGVTRPRPVIHTRRGRVVAAATISASASCLNVASVRPAIGRTNRRSTTRGKRLSPSSGRWRVNSCSIVTWLPAVVDRMCQVTSIPCVAPPTCWKRSRRSFASASSAHCSARHQTGMPNAAPDGPHGGHRRCDAAHRCVTEWSPVR